MRCAAGDLAVIVQAGDVPSNRGLFVEVLRLSDPYPDGTPAWTVRSLSAPIVGFNALNNERTASHVADVPDAWMDPIRPPRAADPVRTEAVDYAFG